MYECKKRLMRFGGVGLIGQLENLGRLAELVMLNKSV